MPRSFLLVRHRDISGVSGAGPVAEGVEWTDGSASLRWRGEWSSTAFWEAGILAILAVTATTARVTFFTPTGRPRHSEQLPISSTR